MEKTTLIRYNKQEIEEKPVSLIVSVEKEGFVQWYNSFRKPSPEDVAKILHLNDLDEFISKLLFDEYSNKMIELNNVLFASIEVVNYTNNCFDTEKMAFIFNANFIWSIQERDGDYFDWIRERLRENTGIVRNKNGDYLFFLILESIIDNYQLVIDQISNENDLTFDSTNLKATPKFISIVENRKQEIFKFKKAARSLRDTITKLEQVDLYEFNNSYYNELKDQINNLISDVDFELQELESKINLIFSIQAHHLNEIMKTLTIFSIIFTPLSFLVGLYGMNFENMPELHTKYGYFVLLGVMVLITLVIVWYLKRKKWL